MTYTPLARFYRPSRRGDWLGIHVNWFHDRDRLSRALDLAADIGVGFVRINGMADWTFAESTSGVFTPTQFQWAAEAAASRGLDVIATGSYTPNWAADGTNNNTHTPGYHKGRFSQTLFDAQAEHYQHALSLFAQACPTVRTIEAWTNEGNCAWGATPIVPSIAFQMLQHCASGWRHGHGTRPNIVLTNATGATYTNPTSGTRTAADWNAALYAEAARRGVQFPADAINHHAYATWGDPYTTAASGAVYNQLVYQTQLLIWYAAVHGLRKPYVWSTEAGFPTLPTPGYENDCAYLTAVGDGNAEVGAARRLDRDLTYWGGLQDSGFTGPYITYFVDETDTPGFGLLRADGSRKPSVDILREHAATAWSGPRP